MRNNKIKNTVRRSYNITSCLGMKNIILMGLLACAFPFAHAKDIPGSSPTSYGVSSSGAFQFQIPIVIPAGRNGVQPTLSLGYSSGGGNGLAGVGWGVSGVGAITRCGRTIATDGVNGGVSHDQNDRFCLNGQRLKMIVGTTYGAPNTEYRTELDSFAKIVAYGSVANVNGGSAPAYWKVWNRSGMISEYGNTTTSKFRVTNNSIHAWKLNKSSDHFGNAYNVVYEKTHRQLHEITYDGGHKIIFNHAPRTDIRVNYIVGQQLIFNERLASITVKRNTTTLRNYDLAFEYANVSKKLRLTSVTECGLGGECMPPINIDWKTDAGGFQTATAAKDKPRHAMIQHYSYLRHLGGGAREASTKQLNYGAWIDINGDGKTDQVIAYKNQHGTSVFKTYLKTDTGWSGDQAAWHLPRPLRSYQNSIVNSWHARFLPDVINQGQLIDVNGDGLIDVVYAYRLYTHPGQAADVEQVLETYINNGSGFNSMPSVAYQPKDLIYDYMAQNAGTHRKTETVRGRFVDINGDGLVDWIRAYYHHYNATSYKATWLNTGNGWASSPSAAYQMPDIFVEYTPRPGFNLPHGQFVDMNGDGLLDWVQAYKKSGPNESASPSVLNTWLNTGSGFEPTPDPLYKPVEAIYEGNLGHNAPFPRGSFVDLNGDGLADWVRSYISYTAGDSNRYAWLNTGRGWLASTNYRPDFVQFDASGMKLPNPDDYQPRDKLPLLVGGSYIDINGDGLVDYTESRKYFYQNTWINNTWINNGNGWTQDNSHNVNRLFADYHTGQPKELKIGYGQFVDVNNDGSPDWVQHRSGLLLETRLNNVSRNDQLSKITTTLGVEIKPTFATLTSSSNLYTKGTGAPEIDARHITGAMYVTSELKVSNGTGMGFNTTKYVYGGAQAHRKGRGFLGFKTFESRNLAAGISQTTTFRQDYPVIGRADETITREISNTNQNEWLSKTTNIYHQQNLHGLKTKFPYLYRSTSETAELNGNGGGVFQWSQTTNAYKSGTYGRLDTSTTETGSSATDKLQKTIVDYEYHGVDTTNWHTAQVDYTTTTTSDPRIAGNSSVKVMKNSFTYYTGHGKVHTTTRQAAAYGTGSTLDFIDEDITLNTSYEYDTYGNVTKTTESSTELGADDRESIIAYDPATFFRLPKTLTNDLGHESEIIYRPYCDVPASADSVDGQTTTYDYDGFCRQTSVTDPAFVTQTTKYHYAGSTVAMPTGQCGTSGCPTTPKFAMTTQVQSQAPVYAFYNLHGNPFLSVSVGMGLNQVIKQQTDYDALGRVFRKSHPYFDGEQVYWTTNEYDTLNRATKTILAYKDDNDITATSTYSFDVDSNNEQVSTSTNPLGHTKTVYANGLGQIVEVKDAKLNSLEYEYDSQGNLTETEDSEGNIILVKYDALGRRKELNDPDLGVTKYKLDAFGQLRNKEDAKGQVMTMRYDSLGRIEERDVPLTSDPNSPIETSYFSYDDVSMNALGKPSSISKGTPLGQVDAKYFGYDSIGRPNATVTYIKGERFAEAITYTTDGQIDTRQFPDSGIDTNGDGIQFAIKYNYDPNGFLTEISGLDAAGNACISHWKANEYDAFGRIKQDTLGNIVRTTRTFDPAQGVLDRIESIVTVESIGLVQELDYKYDTNNNLKRRESTVDSISTIETFEYDELDRLEFHHKGQETVEVRYNDIGNITYKSDVGDYSYTGQGGPHAVSRVSTPMGGSYTSLAKFQVDWEWNGETVTLQTHANVVDSDYTYDANGNIMLQGNRSVSWTTFDKPASMMLIGNDGAQRGSLIEYDAEFNRHYKQEAILTALGQVSQVKETTYYIGQEYEKIIKQNGDMLHRYTINTGGGTVQIERQDGSGIDKPTYFLGDNLGSINVIIDAFGEVKQRLTLDPWGMRTNAGDPAAVNSITSKGYTGHEMDDEVGLINMNARVYDPLLGVFLSADPVLPDVGDMQAFNRYMYVQGNSMKYVDPTGNYLETFLYYVIETVIADGVTEGVDNQGSGSLLDAANSILQAVGQPINDGENDTDGSNPVITYNEDGFLEIVIKNRDDDDDDDDENSSTFLFTQDDARTALIFAFTINSKTLRGINAEKVINHINSIETFDKSQMLYAFNIALTATAVGELSPLNAIQTFSTILFNGNSAAVPDPGGSGTAIAILAANNTGILGALRENLDNGFIDYLSDGSPWSPITLSIMARSLVPYTTQIADPSNILNYDIRS